MLVKVRIGAGVGCIHGSGGVTAIRCDLTELRIDYGPGYQVYFVRRGEALIVLLAGGDKSTQSTDIARARDLADRLEAE